jgi:hypothetical protein
MITLLSARAVGAAQYGERAKQRQAPKALWRKAFRERRHFDFESGDLA